MSQSKLKCALSAMLALLVFNACADTPQTLRLIALTEPALAIPKNGVGIMRYNLTNQGKKTAHLTMQPMAGVIQEVTSDSCDEIMTLSPNQSCILNLRVYPEQTLGLRTISPQICVEPSDSNESSAVCVGPQAHEQISIRALPADKGSISVKIKLPHEHSKSRLNETNWGRCFASFASCTLTLFQGSDVTGVLKITNTSSVSITNLMAYNLPSGVTQNASACALLAPGATCNLVFTAGNIHNLGTTVSVYGANTPISLITVQVLGIGDSYNGQQLFQLPSIADPNFYTAAASDSSPLLNFSWAQANTACVNSNSSLPAIQQLQNLYNASNCNAGPIGGFNCSLILSFFPPYYWSSDDSIPNFVPVIDFSTGGQTTIQDDDLGFGRCIKGYSLVYSLAQ